MYCHANGGLTLYHNNKYPLVLKFSLSFLAMYCTLASATVSSDNLLAKAVVNSIQLIARNFHIIIIDLHFSKNTNSFLNDSTVGTLLEVYRIGP